MGQPDTELIDKASLQLEVGRTPLDLYVIWTGDAPPHKADSMRAKAFARVGPSWTPLKVRELLLRASVWDDGKGYDPKRVRDALRLHQMAKPAVYLLARRSAAGDFEALQDVVHAGRVGRRIAAGALIIDRSGHVALAGQAVAA